jgi:uncharacterized protein involved in outer membrane biogenesis
MRRILTGFAIAAVALVVFLAIAVSLVNVNRFRPSIQAELQKKLNRPVTLGTLHLRLLPFSIRADGLTISQSAAFPSPYPFATAKEVYASASLLSLISGKPTVKALTLDQPHIELIRNAAGEWNFSDLEAGAQGGTASPGKSSSDQLTLDKLQINNGQVAITDEHAKTGRSVYNNIDLKITDFGPGKQFNVYAAAHLPGPGKELVSLTGKGGPLQPANTPVSGRLLIEQVSLAALNGVMQHPLPPNTDALTSGNADVTTANDTISCRGSLTLDDATVHGTKLGYPVNAQYELGWDEKTDQLAIKSATVKAGTTAVSLAGNVNSGVKPADLNVRLSTNNASVPELMNVVNLLGGGSSSSNNQIKGSLSANLNIRGRETAPNVQGELSASTLQAQQLVLNNVRATLNMDNGVARLAPLSAGIFGGQANGDFTVDLKPAQPVCSVHSKFSGVDTNALLSAMSSMKDTVYGNLTGDANVSFALESAADIARTLNGALNFEIANGHLKNINILSELSKVGKFLNSTPGQTTSGTVLQKLSGTFNIQSGVANTNNLEAVMPEGSLSATGSMNLVNEGLDMHLTAVLSNGVSKNVGGTGIGGFMNAALANSKGELVLPVIVSGTMAHPVFAPDVQSIAKMKLNHLLPTAANPGQLTNGVVGSVLGGVLGKSPQQNKQPQNPINSLLNQLGKKK